MGLTLATLGVGCQPQHTTPAQVATTAPPVVPANAAHVHDPYGAWSLTVPDGYYAAATATRSLDQNFRDVTPVPPKNASFFGAHQIPPAGANAADLEEYQRSYIDITVYDNPLPGETLRELYHPLIQTTAHTDGVPPTVSEERIGDISFLRIAISDEVFYVTQKGTRVIAVAIPSDDPLASSPGDFLQTLVDTFQTVQ